MPAPYLQDRCRFWRCYKLKQAWTWLRPATPRGASAPHLVSLRQHTHIRESLVCPNHLIPCFFATPKWRRDSALVVHKPSRGYCAFHGDSDPSLASFRAEPSLGRTDARSSNE